MKLNQFRPSGLTVKIAMAEVNGEENFLYTKDPNLDNFMEELLLTEIKKLVNEKDEYLLDFFVDYFEINNFDDILNIDIAEILKKIEPPTLYDGDYEGHCIGWEGYPFGIFDIFCECGEFSGKYLVYSIDSSNAGVTTGHLKIAG